MGHVRKAASTAVTFDTMDDFSDTKIWNFVDFNYKITI
jgi:hypothetical protein